MSKYGVGVGDDFPVDDGGRGNPPGGDQGQPKDDREEFEAWRRRRDEYRARREEWQRQRDEWRARRRAFKEKVREAARESFGARGSDFDDRDYYGRHNGRRGHYPFMIWPAIGILIPILVLALIISLIAAIFKSPFAFLALVALGFAVYAWRHHHVPHQYGYNGRCRDYDFDLKPTNGGRQNQPPATPAQNGGAIITPPPSSDEGKSTT